MTALTPDHYLPLLQSTFSGICRSRAPPYLSPISALTLFRLQGEAGYEHTLLLFPTKCFPHLRCELGLIRGRVKHSAKEICQWSTVADSALTGFPHNLKTCNMKWPQRTLSKISAFWKWQNYHSKFLIYFRAHSWCCTVYGFGQRYNDIYSLL